MGRCLRASLSLSGSFHQFMLRMRLTYHSPCCQFCWHFALGEGEVLHLFSTAGYVGLTPPSPVGPAGAEGRSWAGSEHSSLAPLSVPAPLVPVFGLTLSKQHNLETRNQKMSRVPTAPSARQWLRACPVHFEAVNHMQPFIQDPVDSESHTLVLFT